MRKYAREDTHYLLYIYDRIRQDIVKTALEKKASPESYLKSVLNSSKEVTLKTYQKPATKNDAYYASLSRFQQIWSRQKVQIFKNLWKWRETLARQIDENPRYILPQNVFIKLIEDQPKTVTQLLKNFKNLISAVHSNADTLIEVLNANSVEEKLEEEKNTRSETKNQDAGEKKTVVSTNNKVLKFSVETREPTPVKEFITDRVFQLIDFSTAIHKAKPLPEEKFACVIITNY